MRPSGAAFGKQHPYDEALTGLEDVAWAKWAQTQGHRIAYAAHAEIVHVHEETPRRVYERYRREGMAFKRIFPESHFSVYDFVRLSVSNIHSDLQEAGRQSGRWRHAAIHLLVSDNAILGDVQGLSSIRAGDARIAADLLLSPAARIRLLAHAMLNPSHYKDHKHWSR